MYIINDGGVIMREAIIISGPAGCGKTTYIAKAIEDLILEGVPCEDICCITFTNKARDNMRKKVNRGVHVSTIHSLIYSKLAKDVNLLTSNELSFIFSRLCAKYTPDNTAQELEGFLRCMASNAFKCSASGNARDYREYYNDLSKCTAISSKLESNCKVVIPPMVVCEIWKDYIKDVASEYVSFDELIVKGKFNLELDYKHVFIDEFQDTNYIEFMTILSVFKWAKLYLMCDVQQSIYGWRGAQVKFNYHVLKDIANIEVVKLNEVYRCPQGIVNLGTKLIGKDSYGVSAVGGKSDISGNIYVTFDEQLDAVLDGCISDLSLGRSVAILGRTNMNLKPYIAKASSLGYPVRCRIQHSGTAKTIYNRVESLLKMKLNPHDGMSFTKLMNTKYNKLYVSDLDLPKKPYDRIPASLCMFGKGYVNNLLDNKSNTYIVFDCETTGLDYTCDEIIQLSAVKFNPELGVIGEFDMLVSNTRDVGESVHTHHFTNKMLDDNGKPISEVLDKFLEFAGDSFFVGHNIGYDVTMLNLELARNGFNVQIPYIKTYDTLTLSKMLLDSDSYKLGHLNEKFNLGANPNHNALEDVRATAVLFDLLLKTFESSSDTWLSLVNDIRKLSSYKQFYIELDIINGCKTLSDCIVELSKIVNADAEIFKALSEDILLSSLHIHSLRECVDSLNKLTLCSVPDMDKGAINILTVHQSKGLEFDSVYYISGGSKFKTRADIPEENRVLYVATTRTRYKLNVSTTENMYPNRLMDLVGE